MKKSQVISELRRAWRDPARAGDAAIYKSDLLGSLRARAEIEQAIMELPSPYPDVDVDALAALPRGTLGREYIEFLRANGLQPFRISDQLDRGVLRRNVFVARYSLVHDIFHVLTGFDTRYAGELGVWAFVVGQRYHPRHWRLVAVACLLYPLLAPLQIFRMWRNLRLGRRIGRRAACLVTVPFEQCWSTPVAELRDELGIEPAHDLDEKLVWRVQPGSAP
jgi:ubiquinone biosynthesis protein COQ4